MKPFPATGIAPVATHLLAVIAAGLLALCAAPAAHAATHTGGAAYAAPEPPAGPTLAAARPTGTATLAPDGRTAVPPAGAPAAVRAAIEAANRIVGKPYRYGGGHARLRDTGYDCSGTVSAALRGARLLTGALDSSSLMGWGRAGRGRWITVYAHGGHAYAVIAGLRLDTSGPGERGPRWRPQPRSSAGFVARHPAGL